MAIYKTEDLNFVEFEAENTCPPGRKYISVGIILTELYILITWWKTSIQLGVKL